MTECDCGAHTCEACSPKCERGTAPASSLTLRVTMGAPHNRARSFSTLVAHHRAQAAATGRDEVQGINIPMMLRICATITVGRGFVFPQQATIDNASVDQGPEHRFPSAGQARNRRGA